jgi:hypothetical protein
MRFRLASLCLLAVSTVAWAQCPAPATFAPPAAPRMLLAWQPADAQATAPAPAKSAAPAKMPQAAPIPQEELINELDFMKDGPRLYSMDAGKAEAARSGKPLICWMGPHIFANKEARRVSLELKDTTIQATMTADPDQPEYDVFNPRVKFTTDNYTKGAKVYFMQVKNFGKDAGDKILTAASGAPVKTRDPLGR